MISVLNLLDKHMYCTFDQDDERVQSLVIQLIDEVEVRRE